MSALDWARLLALTSLGAPAVAFVVLATRTMLARPWREERIGRFVGVAFTLSVLAAVALLAVMLALEIPALRVSFGVLFQLGHYRIEPSLSIDRLSLPFVLITSALCGIVGAFSHRYLHLESGYNRFFVLLTMFASAMLLLVTADSAVLVFASWELLGITSALLVAFYHERRGPVANGLWVWGIYRISDIGLIAMALLLVHTAGSEQFSSLFGPEAWPHRLSLGFFESRSSAAALPFATPLALLVVFAALGKSAQLPFSSWLPRAMEGPTQSSAIFYGALSVHAGAYLLLRVAPLLEQSFVARLLVITLGGTTAIHATLVERTQSDIKAALSYASLAQVGLIFVEIGLGFRLLAVAHIVGHACVRSLQFLRAPSLLRDVRAWRAALPLEDEARDDRSVSPALRALYAHALGRFHLDALLRRGVVEPVRGLFEALARAEEGLVERIKRGADDDGEGHS
ncbi:MAG: proton-conducting membrane transporter [Myxococcales bacterium]|nr:proton-conducting membrane transporter [Myxococcales bacterium]